MSDTPSKPASCNVTVRTGQGTCPVCGRGRSDAVELARYRPFCSKRCADVDLNRWLSGTYVVPGRPAEEGESDLWSDDSLKH